MKKLLFSLGLGLGFVASSFGASQTLSSVTNTAIWGFPYASNSASRVSQIILTSLDVSGTNAAKVALVDNNWGGLTYSNPAYSVISSYGTNWIQTWTNYYGATNSWTNVVLVDVTNNVSAAVVPAVQPLILTAPSGMTAVYTVLQPFYRGIWVTNMSPTNVNITVTYSAQ